jgi:mannose-6-phosphate isomerase-like protein (cupin superfamily)
MVGDAVTFIHLPDAESATLVVELETVPGGDGPPAHIHPHASERFEVLEGAIVVEQAGDREVLCAGQTHTVPAGEVHRFLSHDKIPARTRVTLAPGGHMAEFLETWYELARAGIVDITGRPFY